MLIIDDRYEVYNDNLEIDKFYKVKDIETNSYVFLKKLEQNKNIKDSFIPNLIDWWIYNDFKLRFKIYSKYFRCY